MACYCDTPSENDQAEIERRAKKRMYFAGTEVLTKDQIENNEIKVLPLLDANTALCNLCKILTEEQMKSISAYYWQIKWRHKTLYDWYLKHVKDDKIHGD